MNKNDEAWGKIFDKLNIINEITKQGYFKITANQIKNVGKREPRLMTKFDFSVSRPAIFKENKISILPLTRGSYILGYFNPYAELNLETPKIKTKSLPEHLQSFDLTNITSESVALNIASASGMINDILEIPDDEPLYSTLTGRMSSRKFDFEINGLNKKIEVNNSQIEIDATYESLDNIAIIEAKKQVPQDFMVRQLYYPYRTLLERKITKPIIPIYFTMTGDVFSFHKFKFTTEEKYSSIKQIAQYDFLLNQTIEIKQDEIEKLLYNTKIIQDNVTLPQANSITRIIDMINFLKSPKNAVETADHYKFDVRQSDYYFNSLKYIDIAERHNGYYCLTDFGKEIIGESNTKKKYLKIVKRMFAHETINVVANYYLKTAGNPDMNKIAELVFNSPKYSKLNMETCKRRGSTIVAWLRWVFSLISF